MSFFLYVFCVLPFVFFTNLFFFFWSKIVLDVEGFSDFFWGFSLDHICYSLASEIKQWFNIKIISCEDKFKKSSLIYFAKFLIPWDDVVSSLFIFLFFSGGGWMFSVILAVFNDLGQNLSSDIRKRDWSINTSIYKKREC